MFYSTNKLIASLSVIDISYSSLDELLRELNIKNKVIDMNFSDHDTVLFSLLMFE